jgi:replicative DNA helicase
MAEVKKIEQIILHNLIKNENYARKVSPFLKQEYFHDTSERKLLEIIQEHIIKYNSLPTKDSLNISLEKLTKISSDEYTNINDLIENISKNRENDNIDWLMSETEDFCKEKAVYNAIMDSINIIDGKNNSSKNQIPEILSKALSVSFDTHIGHDYYDDREKRYEFYHTVEQRIPFDLEYFNNITKGGMPSKTLSVVMAGTGVGKSLFLCHHAANCLKQHKNVLYITCEMSEEKIAERIDANLLDVTMDDLKTLPKAAYDKKIENVCAGFSGKLIIKEYPTATAGANHFRFLLDELWLKRKFKPDVIFVDYLNICASSRLKNGSNVNSYTYVKAIAEELRGLAVEYNVPLFTATQTNRDGYSNSDPDLTNTSESFGLPATADFFFVLISTEELEELNQVMVKQLKNRYNDTYQNRKFIVGINRSKMKLFDIEKNQQFSGNLSKKQEKPEKIDNFFKKNPDGWNNAKPTDWSF